MNESSLSSCQSGSLLHVLPGWQKFLIHHQGYADLQDWLVYWRIAQLTAVPCRRRGWDRAVLVAWLAGTATPCTIR